MWKKWPAKQYVRGKKLLQMTFAKIQSQFGELASWTLFDSCFSQRLCVAANFQRRLAFSNTPLWDGSTLKAIAAQQQGCQVTGVSLATDSASRFEALEAHVLGVEGVGLVLLVLQVRAQSKRLAPQVMHRLGTAGGATLRYFTRLSRPMVGSWCG